MTGVHHAEVVAHRVGEPYGTLVLAVAVTVIEVALIVSLMTAGGVSASTLAPGIEAGVEAMGAPKALVGIIAAVVLLPEGLASLKAAPGPTGSRPASTWTWARPWPASG